MGFSKGGLNIIMAFLEDIGRLSVSAKPSQNSFLDITRILKQTETPVKAAITAAVRAVNAAGGSARTAAKPSAYSSFLVMAYTFFL